MAAGGARHRPSDEVEETPQVWDPPDAVHQRRRVGRLAPHVHRRDAGQPGALDVGLPRVPDEQRLAGADAGELEGAVEDQRVRLAHAGTGDVTAMSTNCVSPASSSTRSRSQSQFEHTAMVTPRRRSSSSTAGTSSYASTVKSF